MTTIQRLALAACAVLTWGCAQRQDSGAGEPARPAAKRAGHLIFSTTRVSNEGRVKKVHGTLRNTFDQPVDGVRYVVSILEGGPPPQVIFRWQHQDDITLAPGERKEITLDVENMRFGSTGTARMKVDAEPVQLGAKEMPPPPDWKSQP